MTRDDAIAIDDDSGMLKVACLFTERAAKAP